MTHPAELPDELTAALDAGWARWDELQAEGCELHFELAADGGVRAELRDLDGAVVRSLSAPEALAVAVPGPPARA
jgi:hypothetical protein